MKLFVLFVIACLAMPAPGGDTPKVKSVGPLLFKIKRSTNANEVVYEARLTGGRFDESEPVFVYWVMKAKRGGGLEPLTGIERSSAYGVSIKNATPTEVIFTLKAMGDRRITARLTREGKRRARATTVIDGKDAFLQSVFIEVQGRGILARPQAAVLKGRTVDSGALVTERLTKD